MSAAFDNVDHAVLTSSTREPQRCDSVRQNVASFVLIVPDTIGKGSLTTQRSLSAFHKARHWSEPLFNIYKTPIGDIIKQHHLNDHMYIDDTQLYIKFNIIDEINRRSSWRIIEHIASTTSVLRLDCVPVLPTLVLCLMPTCPRIVVCNMYAAPHITNCGT